MEELNKTQTVLLTLLVSFVTSIATGIVTVTLMDQAPPGVTRTINRIVERTVETIVPPKTQGAAVVKTIVVKEEDFIIKAVEVNAKATIVILNSDDKIISFGFLINKGEYIVADNRKLKNGETYTIALTDIEKTIQAKVVFDDVENHFALLKLIYQEDFKDAKLIAGSSVILNKKDVRLGQSVIALGQNKEEKIFLGTVVGFKQLKVLKEEDIATSSEKILNKKQYLIKTNLNLGKNNSGGPLVDTDGKVVGINIVVKDFRYTVPVQNIQTAVESLKKEEIIKE